MKNSKAPTIKLLTKHTQTPAHHYDAFPFGIYECTPAAEAALYYGFTPVRHLTPRDIDHTAQRIIDSQSFLLTDNPVADQRSFNFKEKGTLIKMFKEGRFPDLPEPLMIYQERSLKKTPQKGSYKHSSNLDIIGVRGSIAEALAIQGSLAVLEDEGFSNLEVEINSTGDEESRTRFEAALSQFVRDNLNIMPGKMRDACKLNNYALFSFTNELAEQLKEEAPQPIGFLSEESREHFSEVLEYLEGLEVPYRINNTLMANRKVQSHTIFRVITREKDQSEPTVLSIGMRYSPLARSLGFRKNVPVIGTCLSYQAPLTKRKKQSKKKMSPRFCFIHLGFDARLKSLKTINMLRKKNIPMCHCLTDEKLSPQMNTADKLRLPYLVIMGQKEALEDTVLIRNTKDRSQETVPISELGNYLRKGAR